ncbi:MAG TPA: chemotaxis protein CheA [Allosphingosinicella sp.]|nr:chemotaxis protein CheA [Allosphingosinicella sp.]
MEDLISEFIAETREMLDALGSEVVAWEAEPGDRARLDEIFRFVHTVKGNCGFFDLPRLEALSHAAEDALAAVRAGKRVPDAALASAVLAITDRIGELVEALETGASVGSGDDDRLIDALSPSALAAGPTHEISDAHAHDQRRVIRSIRLSVELLDRMMSGVSDMVLARNELARRLRDRPAEVAVEAAFERVSACIAEMRDAITLTRMQRIDSLFMSLPRMVRDLAAELGKQVTLEVDGGDVELDREMIETIRDPLTHIVRNAVDHGIEAPDERAKAGKRPDGALRVSARQAGNQILVEIADDGRGLDGDALVRRAVSNGLLTIDQGRGLSMPQKLALIFEPGLSTAQEVTAISGRGVGMDVVRANVERIGGVVEVDSKPGQGLRLTLRVPLTLTIIPALTVSVGGGTYAIPRSTIEEIVRSSNPSVRIETLGAARMAGIRDKHLPLVSLAAILGVDEHVAAEQQSLIVLKPAGGDAYALLVDLVHDHEELVVKPAAPLVMATGLYAGTTLADDGRPVLLLDPSGLASSAGLLLDQKAGERLASSPAAAEEAPEPIPVLLFRSVEGVKRAIRLAEVERIEGVGPDAIRLSGGRLRVAVDGRIVPLAGCSAAPAGPIRILRLCDGERELAYGFAEVIDIVSFDGALQPAADSGEVGGVTLIGGEQVEVIDSYRLFAAYALAGAVGANRPVCALPGSDPWMANLLRPILEGAGYRVVAAEQAAAGEVDVLIAGADEPVPAGGAPVVRVRSRPEAAAGNDDSIYRYDHEALLSALSSRLGNKEGRS